MSQSYTGAAEDALIADPEAYFASPDLVVDADLPLETRRKILKSWLLDATRLDASESEAMGGGERSHLQRVSNALERLDEGAPSPDATT